MWNQETRLDGTWLMNINWTRQMNSTRPKNANIPAAPTAASAFTAHHGSLNMHELCGCAALCACWICMSRALYCPDKICPPFLLFIKRFQLSVDSTDQPTAAFPTRPETGRPAYCLETVPGTGGPWRTAPSPASCEWRLDALYKLIDRPVIREGYLRGWVVCRTSAVRSASSQRPRSATRASCTASIPTKLPSPSPKVRRSFSVSGF